MNFAVLAGFRRYDYYPFGMTMPDRTFGNGGRYGFNGKENDKDISPGGQDYGMRINDNRLGRFLSVDPLTQSYPELTPYQFASNSPIAGVDLDGKEFKLTISDPNVSQSFMWAWEAGDVYRARKIIFDALHKKVSKEVIDNVNDNATNTPDDETLRPMEKINLIEGVNQADLEYFPDISGLEIVMNKGIGRPYNAKAETDFTFIWAVGTHVEKTENHDAYPVDVRVIESPIFKNYYGDNDFHGSYKIKYGGSSLPKAPIGFGVGTGVISLHIKGYGLVAYKTDLFGLSTTGVGMEIGGISGKFNIKDYSPATLAGYGASYAGGWGIGVNFQKGKFYSFSNMEDMLRLNFSKAVASGTSNAMSSGIPFSTGLSLSGSLQYSVSTIIEPKEKK